jgi:phage baseplate assembly protein W
MSTVVKNTPIGLIFPLRDGEKSGYFDQSYDSFTAYRMNIINLLRTIPGERRMNPSFGSRLWTVIFEQNDDLISDKISQIVKEDIAEWIPGVSVSSVQVKYDDSQTVAQQTDTYKLYIAVTYIVDSIKQEDVVDIVLNSPKV